MSALMRVTGEVRSVDTRKNGDGEVWGRIVTVLTEVGDRLGDGVKVVLFTSDDAVSAKPRETVDWLVAVEAGKFGLNARYVADGTDTGGLFADPASLSATA